MTASDPYSILGALPLDARGPMRTILDRHHADPDTVAALGELADVIRQLQADIGALRVEADRRELAAMDTAQSCEYHGQRIAELESLSEHFQGKAERAEQSRAVVVSGMWRYYEAVWRLHDLVKAQKPVPSSDELIRRWWADLSRLMSRQDATWRRK